MNAATPPYSVLVDRWGQQVLLYVRELPGFQVTAFGYGPAVTQLETALRAHEAWLREGGLPTPGAGPEFRIVEDKEAHGGVGTLLDSDLSLITAADVATATAVCRERMAQLERLARSADPTRDVPLYDVPDRGEGYDADRVLVHLADMDSYYLQCVGAPAIGAAPAHPLAALEQTDRAFWGWVRRVADAPDLAVVTDESGESWTTAKLLRRRLGHLHEHVADLEALA